jgi:hypothetical protein
MSDKLLIKHKNMRTVAFWPISREAVDAGIRLKGYWYCYQIKDLLDTKGPDTITIKRQYLGDWYPIDKHILS